MAAKRQTILVVVLAVVAAVGLYNWLQSAPGVSPGPASARTATGRSSQTPANGASAPEVRLETLGGARPAPNTIVRNLFRFKPKPAPKPEPVAYVPPPPPGPPPPPPIPPIGLKFIGVLEPNPSTRIAILSDGRGAPIYGKEGEAVLGQYRILQINADSIEMAYLDGQGRQRIRLSGS